MLNISLFKLKYFFDKLVILIKVFNSIKNQLKVSTS